MEQKTLLKNKKNQGNGGETMAKRDDSVKKKDPELRFKGFTDDWEQRRFGSTVTIERGGSPRPISKYITNSEDGLNWIKIGDAPEEGNYITHTAEKILPEGLSKTREVHPGDLILSNSMSFGKPYIMEIDGCIHDGWLLIRNDKNKFELKFLCVLLGTDNMINQYKAMAAGSTVNNLNKQLVGGTTVSFPSSPEQQQIGAFFDHLDTLISLHQRKLDLLKEQKKGFLQKMFPKNGEKVPELRFAGFADDWEERKLSSGLREYTDRVIVEDDKEYYQISVRNNFGGITLRGSKMGNKIGRKRQAKINLTKYPQTLIFTRQTVEQGGIGWVDKYCDGAIVTENMPTISLDTSVFSKYFLTNLFQTRIFYKNAILDNIEGGSAQIAIHESKFLSSTLLFPNLDEQEKIGQFFKQLDDTIALHQRKLDLLKEQKKGFLQKMFV